MSVICLSVLQSVGQSVSLLVCQSVYLSVCFIECQYVCLSFFFSQSVCLLVCQSVSQGFGLFWLVVTVTLTLSVSRPVCLSVISVCSSFGLFVRCHICLSLCHSIHDYLLVHLSVSSLVCFSFCQCIHWSAFLPMQTFFLSICYSMH